jgi:uncharacterized membrane protein YfcA
VQFPPSLPSEFPEIVAASIVIFAAATLQGSVGFGLSLVAAPILMLLDPRYVPGPLLAVSILLTILTLWREHRHVDFGGIGPVLVGRLPGTLLGLWLLVALPARVMSITFGVMLLAAVAMSASPVRFEPTPRTLAGAGLLSGIMSMTTSAGGPPLALVYQSSAGATLRATLSGHFLIGATISLLALRGGGRLGESEIVLAALLAPGLLLGFLVSSRIRHRLDAGYTRMLVLLVSGTAGAAVILRELLG